MLILGFDIDKVCFCVVKYINFFLLGIFFMKKKASLHNGHWERVRQRIITLPVANLTDADVLEGLLQFVFRRADTNEIARRILEKFGNVTTLLDANYRDLEGIEGLGETSINKLLALFKCMEYLKMEHARQMYSRPTSTANAFDLVKHHFRNLDKEILMAFYINNNYQVLHSEVVARGGKSLEVHMDYEHICNQAKLHRATKVIIAHNHPTGDVGPSEADYLCTCRLYALLRQNDISLIDHIIIGDKTYLSFFSTRMLSYIAEMYEEVVRATQEKIKESKLFYIPR